MTLDVFFLSYLESNREKNWFKVKKKYPRARWIHGVKGLALAHKICANLSQTDFFFLVNGDNEICEDFKFKVPVSPLKPAVYCWRSLNPVNGLIYGFGGVKLFPKSFFFSPSFSFVDMSTSFNYQIVNELASVTRFNASALEAWRGAFRESVKLSSECIEGQKSKETKERLNIWCEKGEDVAFGKYVLQGARQGRIYGKENKNNKKALSRINDFNWLKEVFIDKGNSLLNN
ncbi:MAG: hypothetical protein GDA46_00805 [Bdellovibrionales bacterium]|nr:hypothetical protein [Bdellovibrionales bacterium]